jgi:hypothetical protein
MGVWKEDFGRKRAFGISTGFCGKSPFFLPTLKHVSASLFTQALGAALNKILFLDAVILMLTTSRS